MHVAVKHAMKPAICTGLLTQRLQIVHTRFQLSVGPHHSPSLKVEVAEVHELKLLAGPHVHSQWSHVIIEVNGGKMD